MKNLIIYYSYTGNNRFLAERLQKQLDCELIALREQKERKTAAILWDLLFRRKSNLKAIKADWQKFDQLIFIAPIWDKGIATPMKTFLMKEKDSFGNYSFFTVCTGRRRQNEKLTQQLVTFTGRRPDYVYELEVNDLLPPHQKGKVKYTTPYRISEKDFHIWGNKFDEFKKLINSEA